MVKAPLDRYLQPCPKGTVLFGAGEPADRMYVVQSGRVELVKQRGGLSFLVATMVAGDSVGEMELLDGQPRAADAVVTEDATLLVLDRDTFEALVRENVEIAVRIMRKLSERLREATQAIEGLLARNGTANALQALRRMAGDGPGFRALGAEASPRSLAARSGLSQPEAELVWERLRIAGVVTTVDGGAALAPEAIVDEYLAYLSLKERYDPMSVGELVEATGLTEDEVHRVARRVLTNRLPASGAAGLADSYQQFLTLKRRFEYPERR